MSGFVVSSRRSICVWIIGEDFARDDNTLVAQFLNEAWELFLSLGKYLGSFCFYRHHVSLKRKISAKVTMLPCMPATSVMLIILRLPSDIREI